MEKFIAEMKQDAEHQWQDHRDAMMRAEGVAIACEQMLAELRGKPQAEPES